MRVDELHGFLKINVLTKYNLYRCYSAVFDINHSLWSVGLENFMFPETEHLDVTFSVEEKLSEQFFSSFISKLSEPHFNEIELSWFRHCEDLERFKNEI